MYAVNLSIENW